MFIYMLSTINFKDEVGDIFSQKLKWVQCMPSSRKSKVDRIYYYNPDNESKMNKISELFKNLKYVNTNITKDRILDNYISDYDLIFINRIDNNFNRQFLIKNIEKMKRIDKEKH